MDPTGDKQKTTCSKKKRCDHSTYDSNILQPTWFRRAFRPSDELDRFLPANRYYLLFHISPVFWLILLFTKK